MDVAHVVLAPGAVFLRHAAHGVGALQRHDSGAGLVQVVGGHVLAGDGLEELGL